tara:strand:- start:1111 stop:1458 length:348 start_codon:yes stop_codon:yes gene_type:complete
MRRFLRKITEAKALIPTKFYGYTTHVTIPLFKFDKSDELSKEELRVKDLAHNIKTKVLKENKSVRWDNKVAIQCKIQDYSDETIYIYFGYYDGRVTLGLGVRQHETFKSKPIELG